MLGRRLISAAFILTGLILLIYLDFQLGKDDWLGRPGLILAVLGIVVGTITAGELTKMLREHHPELSIGFAMFASAVMITVSALPVLWKDYPVDCQVGLFGWSMMGLTAAIGLAFLFEMIRYTDDSTDVTNRIAHYILIFGYLLMLFGFMIGHRLLFRDNAIGMLSVICMITTVKMSDSAAYFVGKSFGKNKLAPVLSPGKTIEGLFGSFLGGWLGAAIVVFLVARFMFDSPIEKQWWWFLVYGAVVTFFGIIGDLAESLLKRDARIKDSSKSIPGMGGFMDVIDSLVFAAPISYFLWLLGDSV